MRKLNIFLGLYVGIMIIFFLILNPLYLFLIYPPNYVDEVFEGINDSFKQKLNQEVYEDLNILVINEDWFLKERSIGYNSLDNIIIFKGGISDYEKVFWHEIGHSVWEDLDKEQKKEWEGLFDNSTIFITNYAGKNYKEDFAENFAFYMMDKQLKFYKLDKVKRDFLDKNVKEFINFSYFVPIES